MLQPIVADIGDRNMAAERPGGDHRPAQVLSGDDGGRVVSPQLRAGIILWAPRLARPPWPRMSKAASLKRPPRLEFSGGSQVR